MYKNLFYPYSENNNNPKENNLSRGIAILLEENTLFFDRFIDLINAELKKNNHELIAKPNNREERKINIQQSASNLADNLEGIQRIIPVTLTPEKINSQDGMSDTQNPIPDISIFCNSNDDADLIIIEAKQYQLNADAQVLNQAEAIKNSANDSKISIIEPVTRLTWQEIITILQNMQQLQEGRGDFVLNHYLEYLKNFRQYWFPVEPFRAGMTETMMWKRIWPLANNCAKLLNLDDNSIGENDWCYRVFLKECNYLKEFDIALNYDNNVINGINICLYPGNTSGQSWNLFANNDSIANPMSWINEKKIKLDDSTELNINTKFFLHLFNSFGPHIMSAYLSNNIIGTDKSAICENFCKRINGKWHNENWDDLKNFLINEHPGILEDQETFIAEFDANIQQSGKTCFNAALGFEIVINLPIDLLAKLDKKNSNFMANPENDAAARIITSAVKKVRQMIEK